MNPGGKGLPSSMFSQQPSLSQKVVGTSGVGEGLGTWRRWSTEAHSPRLCQRPCFLGLGWWWQGREGLEAQPRQSGDVSAGPRAELANLPGCSRCASASDS